MTDQQTYTTPWGDDLIRLRRCSEISDDLLEVRLLPEPSLAIALPTPALLAMIDTVDPDAMRAYLRERSDLMDSPDESCLTLEDMLPADLAAEAARFREVPEADSPEDVDERPDPYADARAAGKQIGETMRAFRDSYIEAMKL